jgi:hypothetical protein
MSQIDPRYQLICDQYGLRATAADCSRQLSGRAPEQYAQLAAVADCQPRQRRPRLFRHSRRAVLLEQAPC